MEILGVIVGTILFFTILYFVVKAAVRNGICEAREHLASPNADAGPFADGAISQTKCLYCGENYDIDYPRCPVCKQ